MEETGSIWQQLLQWTLITGGLLTTGFLIRHERKNPPDHHTLTQTISGRAWNAGQIVLLLGTLFLLYFLAGFTGRFFYPEQLPPIRLIVTLLIYAILTIEIGLINRRRGGNWAKSLGMGTSNLWKLRLAPLIYLAAIPFIVIAAKLYHLLLTVLFSAEPELQEVAEIVSREIGWLEISYMTTAIFAAPVYEELMFRGILFPYLLKRTNLAVSTFVVAILFALIHFHTPSLVPLGLLSATLSLAYWRTGSLWVCIGVHMLFNAVTILALNLSG